MAAMHLLSNLQFSGSTWICREIPRPAGWLSKCVTALVFLLPVVGAMGALNIDPARVKDIAALLPPQAMGLGRPITDRAAWSRLATNAGFAGVVAQAEKLIGQPVPALTDDLFLDFSRTGNRDRGQAVIFKRLEMGKLFVLAECLENRGRFIGPFTNLLAAICADRTWVYPAHDRALDNFNGRTVEMDLRATAEAWNWATADYQLGDKLPPEVRRLIRDNVRRRVLGPFRDMVEGRRSEIFWMRVTHNWNAVCLAGVTGAALALEDSPEQRAWFIAAAQDYIKFFLKGFTPDGYCSEGLGYWNYGFGSFVMLGETIRQATGSRIDLLADSTALAPALFPLRDEIWNGVYPTIADCSPGSQPDAQCVRYLVERLGQASAGRRDKIFLAPAKFIFMTALFAFLPEKLPVAQRADLAGESRLRTWFKDGGVLICRPASGSNPPFAAALKGGNNAENHNHNDVGSFSVVAGGTMVICDPGSEVYTARTFSSKRYESKVLNSFGHAVPVIAGKLQRPGAVARAVVLRTEFGADQDTLALDIRSAYDVPELKKLERTFVFHRTAAAALSIRDEVEFTTPQNFEAALITWGKWSRVSANELLVRDGRDAVRVTIDTAGKPFEIAAEKLDEHVHSHALPTRVGIVLKSAVQNAVVTLTITPEASK